MQQLCGAWGPAWGQVSCFKKVPVCLSYMCLKLYQCKSLRTWKTGVQVAQCKRVAELYHRGEWNFNLILEFLDYNFLSFILQIRKGVHIQGGVELRTFSGKNISTKCCWYVAKLTLTLFVKQRLWLCLAAQLPSVPSKVASSHVGCKNDQV